MSKQKIFDDFTGRRINNKHNKPKKTPSYGEDQADRRRERVSFKNYINEIRERESEMDFDDSDFLDNNE